ncbi:VCBS repeat-containing protein [Flagellimonas sp. HMM57]|uniref:VCBS repeat-containing protein n=1 Tax=unclassified Flagellimonas TaxID=2644544 RepID=UPI0013D1825B|nr:MULTISPECIES: VCBS repeat-containing protein [unclassified Flagellimonas]UII74612.1 VCBS repeat-containing protein [Flagellimonas sp. HMM57]
MNKYTVSVILLLLVFSCGKKEGELFSNPSAEDTGISFTNTLSESDDLNILDYLYFYNGGGVAIGDINNDGLPDIFFSGNQVKNALYLNKGDLKFEDISEKAGIQGNSTWNTGAIMGDVNGDGFLDIYVCAVIGINGFEGANELYINNGDNTFTEQASAYELDFDTYSSSAAFLDYDLDGDLDIYLLNHAVHTQESFGKVDLRYTRNYETGDRLLRNDNGKFTDVSEEAGIYGGINGYGLGIAVSDFNVDGYPDLYIGNDFHEDDYYYLNNGDGTFTESLRKHFGHTTRFSMGSDVTDINHDGLPDFISLDMLPEDEIPLKSSEGDDNIQVQRLRTERYGYHYQFTRNMLYVNQPNGNYLETALLSGVAATDWSWSALFGDYDQDGEQDLFVSNGIPKRPNDLDYIRFISNEQIQKKLDNTKLVDQKALNLMPSGAINNIVFKGKSNLQFENKSNSWIAKDTLISGATAYGDLDNDGDLDLVTNNINRPATIYLNKTNTASNYLKIRLEYQGENPFAIGTKVYSFHQGKLQYKELYTSRGFQSSSEPIVHFGYGAVQKVDSLRIVWPDKSYQTLKNIEVNQTLEIKPKHTRPFNFELIKPKTRPIFKKVEDNLGLSFTHKEDNHIDFNREKLIPYRVSDRGPATAIGDLNGDGKEDVFFGGSKFFSSKIYIQRDTLFTEEKIPELQKDSVKEDVVALIKDFNGDGKNDIFLGSGGADFYGEAKALLNSYFIQKDTLFKEGVIPDFFENTSVIKANDYDKDGDLDLFVGSNVVTSKFGEIPNSYLLKNDKGRLSIVENTPFQNAGMVTDATWDDFDNDGLDDLILIGEWMAPKFFKNLGDTFKEVTLLENELNGLWQTIQPFDIDGDGDMDYLLGNWGTNSKFKASKKAPMRLYFSDFDGNGSTETIVATEKNGKYYPLLGLDELSAQLVFLRKKFNTYKSFAGKTVEELFDKETLAKAEVLQVHELHSGYLKNNGGSYSFVPFKSELQVSPIKAFLAHDFDGDAKKEVLVAGNYFGVTPFHGKFDSFPGALISNENDIILGDELGLELTQKSIRHLNIFSLENRTYLLVTVNNDKAHVYELLK